MSRVMFRKMGISQLQRNARVLLIAWLASSKLELVLLALLEIGPLILV